LEIQRKYYILFRVGKTSLLNSYVDQKFVNSYKATVGADFMEKEVVVDGKVINLEVQIFVIIDMGYCRTGEI
jgi:GTPase SAR1 family protein